MNVNSQKLINFLLEGQFITPDKLENLQKLAIKEGKTFEEIIVDQEIIKDTQLGQVMADLYGWRFLDLNTEVVSPAALGLIPEKVARSQKVIAFAKTLQGIKVSFANPDNIHLIHNLQKKLKSPILPYYSTLMSINSALRYYDKDITSELNELIEKQSKEIVGEDEAEEDSAIIKIVDLLLQYGYEHKASDIHIEPHEDNSVVRFRVDGVLLEVASIPRSVHNFVVTRIKVMAKLHTDEHQKPQDGKLQYEFDGERVDIRISIVPTTKNENVVMRLLAEKSRHFSMTELGLPEKGYAKLLNSINKPWGMILVTGPTGSGKTTSLYAMLKVLNKRSVNIATIEDPVEYNVDGITQIQVNEKAKLNFSSGLKSIVRQDPDIIMVGEIRDEETAEIAVNSAMTGHLVLSTLHTNDAATTLPRLMEMKVDPFLVTSTVNVAVAQRLVRKICQRCIHTFETDLEDIKDKIPLSILEKLAKGKSKVSIYKGKGCKFCNDSGYHGRLGVFEIMPISEEIRKLVMQSADAETIKRKAIEEGMTTMFDDALEKVLNGITTVEELLRVVKLD